MSLINSFHVAASASVAQGLRLNAVASNLANVDSVAGPDGQPYRARHVVFHAAEGYGPLAAGVQVAGVVDSDAPLRRAYQPGHPHADAQGYVQFSNVDAVEQMVEMVAASRSYQMNIDLMSNARQLLQRFIDLGRGA